MPPRLIRLTVFNDFVCPFCYIGHKEIQDALARCADLPVQFEVQYRPFQLCSCLVEGAPPIPKKKFYGKGLNDAEFLAKEKAVMNWAARIGSYAEGGVSQTASAHRLAWKAYRIGGQALQLPALTAIFKAFCTDRKDIGDLDVLGDIAEETGVMSKDEAIEFLRSDELRKEMDKMQADAKTVGLKGVPVVVIDGQWVVSGTQRSEFYVQIFRKMLKNENDGSGEHTAPGSPIAPAVVPVAIAAGI